MTKGIKGLVESKKFLALVTGVVALVGSFFGLGEEQAKEMAPYVAGMVSSYLLAQGASDAFGKGKKDGEGISLSDLVKGVAVPPEMLNEMTMPPPLNAPPLNVADVAASGAEENF